MPRNGLGSFSLAEPPFVAGTKILSATVNSDLSDIATGLTFSISKDGQTTPTANLPMGGQLHTGVAADSGLDSRTEYVAGAVLQGGAPLDAGETAGTSTAYTATLIPAITAYADKQFFRVKFNATSGATPTINFNSVGAKKMYFNIGGTATQVTTGDIPNNFIGLLRYDASLDSAAGGFWVTNPPFSIQRLTETTTVDYYNDTLPIYDSSASANRSVRPEYLLGLMRGHIYGLTLSNNGSDANNDIDIAIGQAVDNTTFALMVLASAITKRLDANWAVGTNQGGLDIGSKANSTWYHVWLIQRPDTGVVDVLFSTSATSPTMPTDYTIKRRIGAVQTDGSGNIKAFYQRGNLFLWNAPTLDLDTVSASTTGATAAMPVPLGVVTEVRLNVYLSSASNSLIVFTSPNVANGAPSATAAPLANLGIASSASLTGNISVITDTSSQIRYRAIAASTTLRLSVTGWTDWRDSQF